MQVKNIRFFIAALLSFGTILFAQVQYPIQTPPPANVQSSVVSSVLYKRNPSYNETLIGNAKGLFAVSSLAVVPLWTEGAVDKILYGNGWFFLTSKGVLFSSDLKTFQLRNEGLPVNTIKEFDGSQKNFVREVRPLKDLEMLASNENVLVTLTKNEVFISKNAGLSWQSLGFSSKTSGGKAVAAAMMDEVTPSGIKKVLTVFHSHALYGLSYIFPDVPGAVWTDITQGFEAVPTLPYMDEIADIGILPLRNSDGSIQETVYLTQSFLPRLYRLDWESKSGTLIAKGTEAADTWDGLTSAGKYLAFMSMDGLVVYDPFSFSSLPQNPGTEKIKKILFEIREVPRCGWFPSWMTGLGTPLSLNELWLTRAGSVQSGYEDKIKNKKSLYVPAGQVLSKTGIDKFSAIIEKNNLNSLVIDMKDDYGLLRYRSTDPLVIKKAQESKYALDIDSFVETFKKKDIYLIARIVVFKDRNLYKWNGGAYAVWDSKKNTPWLGVRGVEDVPGENGNQAQKKTVFYDEYWVDPYSEEVWEYNTAIAKELIGRGFDEIQFDYIRFPTDGKNIFDAQYRWRDKGMDMESALISFLAYARKNIDAPIAIDIYGANGWYRSGTRTGQDVELMAPYVDVICPMFYPSHFEQDFLAYTPIIERPYRVYFYGTYRNTVIARSQVLVRPWIQAFYLNVSFDRRFYDKDYVLRQVYGVRDAADNGYMYWNNSGRYTDLSPDVGNIHTGNVYPWEKEKAMRDKTFRKPAVSNF
ncbi:hypothetical protein H0R92_06120 [Treponema sp. OMZ 840]|uniref:putative glycoside hydrolase n=1 Tax=Treponema sp. OMZ 840 TaxID=244313 RepID=UPI003D8AB58C